MAPQPARGSGPTIQQQRRRSLIDATMTAIAEHGFSGLTLQRIAGRANLTAGTVNFYFTSKEALLFETLETVAEEFEQTVTQALNAAGADPAARLRAALFASFAPELIEPRKVAVWYAFMAEARARADYQRICGQRDGKFTQMLVAHCRAVIASGPPLISIDAQAVAYAISGLIDGLWQDILFSGGSADVAAARDSCLAFLASVFPWAYSMPPGCGGTRGLSTNGKREVSTVVRADSTHLSELGRLFDLYRQFYQQSADEPLARNYIAERLANADSVIFMALDARGRGLGFTQLYPALCSVATRPFFVLYDLYVDREVRGQGIGRALMERAREHAVSSGASRIDLETSVDNTAGQSLYASLGYQRDQDFYKYSLEVAAG